MFIISGSVIIHDKQLITTIKKRMYKINRHDHPTHPNYLLNIFKNLQQYQSENIAMMRDLNTLALNVFDEEDYGSSRYHT
ncbi:hypothetical protein DF214_03055 [Pectobacterium atrosepticum]|nr:hypothetical protein EV46_19100 [Pectobacterium atrosepticum]ATY92354.1 hypothetical protein CVS35_19365 [Pectobacterium atrosepticum]KFX14361.1 hypothetical protein JV34_11070 [Pectobacterium atrosepticum]KFX21352.1 hypothetical protein KP24_20750 [Pectobacterium atrosepticum]PWD65631.1 hypothetical protein DF214_03055 [Pectobacterium atrosepticum]